MERLVLRVFLESENEARATRVADEIRRKIADLGQPELRTVRPYWKIPEYFEVLFVLSGAVDSTTCEKLVARLGTGWEWFGETDAVWNLTPRSTFPVGHVRWAHVELIR